MCIAAQRHTKKLCRNVRATDSVLVMATAAGSVALPSPPSLPSPAPLLWQYSCSRFGDGGRRRGGYDGDAAIGMSAKPRPSASTDFISPGKVWIWHRKRERRT